MEKFSLLTFGCKINQYESQKIKEQFLSMGMSETSEPLDANVCLLNTCSVTARADQKTRKLLRKIHNENPETLIIVTGCYGTASADKDEILGIPGVNFVVSNYEKMDIPSLYAKHRGKKYPRKKVQITPLSNDRTRVYLKIQDGCNLMCTYCKIPYVRNQILSSPIPEVLKEAKEYVQNGFKEIILTGVHLGLYGWRKEKSSSAYSFISLLEQLDQIEGLERIRISSIEINEITSKLISTIQNSSKIAPHFHLPLQSGDDRILKLMNRQYSRAKFLEKVALLQENFQDPGLTTDVIYGFPSESSKEFENTLEVIQQAGFHSSHIFPFSPRRRTPAYKMDGKITPLEMKKRKLILLETAKQVSLQYREKFIGKKLQMLVESNLDGKSEWSTGYSEEYLRCYLPHGEKWSGRMILVQVQEIFQDGVLVQKCE